MPRLPTPTRAARQSSGSESREHSTSEPSAVTSSIASTWLEMFRRRSPVPCVAVEIAPAIVCTSMSPRFSSASPRCVERLAQVARSRSPPSTFDEPALPVDLEHAVHPLEPHHHAVGAGDVGERVARAPRRARSARVRRPGSRPRCELLDRARPLDRRRHALLVARPVAPHGSTHRGKRIRLRRGARREAVQLLAVARARDSPRPSTPRTREHAPAAARSCRP